MEADDDEHDRDHDHHEANHQPGKPRDAFIKAGLSSLFGELIRNRTKLGHAPRVDDEASSGSTQDVAALEAGIWQFDDATTSDIGGGRVFFDRHGFACERRLTDEKVFGTDQTHISRNQ